MDNLNNKKELLKTELINKIRDNELDSIVMNVMLKFIDRAKIGKNKYNTDMDRNDLELKDWINHSLEEQMDNMLYMYKVNTIL
tara:strand:- start:128 stop:376 length:249 start_codon:yes stop_codon:yes gene_type:complete